MAKQSGLGDRLLIDGYDLSGDIGSIQEVGGGPAALDLTDITQSAYDREGGLRDGRMNFTSWFNPAASRAHPRLASLPRTDVQATYCRGYALGAPAASMVAKQIGYDGNRAADGAFSLGVACQANSYGLAWGRQMSVGLQSTGVGLTGASVDFASTTAFGAIAYIHVTAFTGTSAFIGLDHSSDNGSVDPFAALNAGALEYAASGIGSGRLTTSSITTSVKRYLRLYISGTFSAISFLYVLVKPESAQT